MLMYKKGKSGVSLEQEARGGVWNAAHESCLAHKYGWGAHSAPCGAY